MIIESELPEIETHIETAAAIEILDIFYRHAIIHVAYIIPDRMQLKRSRINIFKVIKVADKIPPSNLYEPDWRYVGHVEFNGEGQYIFQTHKFI